ncbi:pectinesterase inhibitor 11-like [Salvia miltiorrhiza]|uniref:pectinesterase inhibitor 11-like n=1 Tax=Salvia miltiorrhiza TaxID=226208 RepID=UPI0025ABC6DB|nr:pectinesterase inhibitor 11-like [Salvia miltiorrhiza]
MRLSLLFLSLLLIASAEARHPAAVRRRSRARAFIEQQCEKTLYPDLCVRYLSCHVGNFTTTLSHQRLAQIALKVSLERAESTRAYVSEVARELKLRKAKHYQEIRDCLDQINDGVAQLSNCIKETEMIKENGGSSDFPWHASNVKTWMSAALSDASMCIYGFSGRVIAGKTKAMIKAKVLNLEQTTSISLALFNRFAARYKASHHQP